MKRAVILNRDDVGAMLLAAGFIIGMAMLAAAGFLALCLALVWWPVSIGIAIVFYCFELIRFCWAAIWE